MKSTLSIWYSVRALALGTLLVATAQCSVSEQVKESPSSKNMSPEARENLAYTQMQYRLNTVDEANLGGQNILLVRRSTDLAAPQKQQLQSALQRGNLPLHLKLRVYARNPTDINLRLKQLDYKLLLDGRELATGTTARDLQLESGAIETLPIVADVNVTQDKLGGSTPAAFAAGLSDMAVPNRRLSVRVRPVYVSAAGRESQLTDYETVELVAGKRPNSRR